MGKLEKISFSFDSFDAILCINGILPHKSKFEELYGVPVIAADGAANQLMQDGVKLNYIVGDLDSLDMNEFNKHYLPNVLVKDADQDTNDFEKCLQFCESLELRNILLFGIHGYLLEHTLNNWSVLKRYSKVLNITVFDDERYAFTINKSCEIEFDDLETVSLIPQTSCTITTKGFEWNLDNETLTMGSREGARNEVKGSKVQIILHTGELLLFCDSRIPRSIKRVFPL